MNQDKQNLIHTLFSDTPIVSTATLRQNGIYSRNIAELIKSGHITRIRQGRYVCNQMKTDISDIALVAQLIPSGVFCLFTAIEHYGLSTVNPTEIYVALPRGTVAPSLPYNLRLNVRQMTKKHFELGASETVINGTTIKMYDIEKTVCDCFKYDREIEKSIALEVLKNYISGKNCNLHKLLEYAKIMGKTNTILPYVEAMV